MNNIVIKKIEEIIGYTFNDKMLLQTAMTHKSMQGVKNYETLEFLGDAVLKLIQTKFLYDAFPNDTSGELTSKRQKIESKDFLAKVIAEMNIMKYLICSNGAKKDGVLSDDKVECDIFESILAVIYIDSNYNYEEAKNFVNRTLKIEMENPTFVDNKSALLEYGAKNKIKIEFVLVKKEGEDHNPMFYVVAQLDGVDYGEGQGCPIRVAHQMAAKNTFEQLEKQK